MKGKVAIGAIAATTIGAGVGLWWMRRPIRVFWDIWQAGSAPPSALAELQRKRLVELVAFARAHSAYYRALYHDAPSETVTLAALPIVTKPELMAHFDEVVTDPEVTKVGAEAFVADPEAIGVSFLGRYNIWTTSGVTGRPGIFVHDRDAVRIYYTLGLVRGASILNLFSAQTIRRFLRRRSHVVLLAATGGHFAGVVEIERLRRRAARLASGVRIFSVLQPLSSLVRELNRFQPTRIGGYPSALMLLADEQRAGRLRIHPSMLTPVGEGLAPAARSEIERVFGCPVRMGYAASEFLGLGYECAQGWMHTNADWAILEPVDANYRPVAPGQRSYTTLLTNLANRVQPLIRYDLGDSIIVRPDPCPCGCPLPAIHIEGRKGDILRLRTLTGELVSVLPLALGTVVEETPGVRRAQVIQTGSGTLKVRLEGADGAPVGDETWEAMERRLRDFLAAQGLTAVTILRASELPQQDATGGKFRQVWNAMQPPEMARQGLEAHP